MDIVEELKQKKTRDNRDLLDRAISEIESLRLKLSENDEQRKFYERSIDLQRQDAFMTGYKMGIKEAEEKKK